MYTLIIVVLMMSTDAPATVHHVPGFSGRDNCLAAALALEAKWWATSEMTGSFRGDLKRDRAVVFTTSCAPLGNPKIRR
jgi:hypothetical protein